MARTKDVILTPEQKEQMEKEYFEALKPLESVNATINHSQYDDVENADLKAIVESVALQQASAGREVVDDTPSSTIPKKRIGDKQRKETLEKYQASFKFRESTTASQSSSVPMYETVLIVSSASSEGDA